MTKSEIAELIDQMPQDMDVNDFIHELVNRALEVEREACAALCSATAAGRDAEAIEEAIRARSEK
jgi:hypothetical protein